MLQGWFKNQATWLIVDTGASDPIFTNRLAAEAGMTLLAAEAGTDHAGASVSTWTSPDALALRIGERLFHFERPLVIQGPSQFATSGIGGVLSPQTLDSGALLLLDLRNDQLQLIRGQLQELAQAISEQNSDLTPLSLPRIEGTGDGTRLVVVRAALASQTVRVLLNTGTLDTELSPDVLPQASPQQKRTVGHGLSGTPVEGQLLDSQKLYFGESEFTLPNVVVRDQGPHYDAQLGMSALKGTILVISPGRDEPILWWVSSRMLK
jgi:hypothetical protein